MKLIVLSIIAIATVAGCERKSETPSSAASVAAVDIDAASPLDKPYRLKSGEELDVNRLFDLLPLYIRPTFEEASFDPSTGATVVTGLKFGDAAAAEGFTVKRAEFYGVDLEKLEKLDDDSDAPVDAPMELIVAKLRLFDVASSYANSVARKTEIEAIEIDSLRVRRGGIPKSSPSSGLATFFNAFDVAGVYFKNARSTSGETVQSESAVAFDFEARDLRFIGLGGGKLKALVARDLDYLVRQSPNAIEAAGRGLGPMASILVNGPLRNLIASENQRTKVKAIEWRNISFAGLMKWGLKGQRPPISERALIDLGTARFVDLETFVGDKRFSVVPDTTISAMEFSWLAPSKIRALTRGGLYDFTAYVPNDEDKAIAILKERKLDKVKGESDFAYDWNPDKGVAVASAGFDSTGFADFDFDLGLEGLDLRKIEAGRAVGALRPAVELARLKYFSIVVADEEMLDAFYELSALQAGGEAKDVRAATPAMMRLGTLELKQENPRIASYIDAIAEFLEDGGVLEIKAFPEVPVPLEAINSAAAGGPEAVAEAVNLTMTHRN